MRFRYHREITTLWQLLISTEIENRAYKMALVSTARGHPVLSKELQRVAVFADYITPHIDIEIFAIYIDVEGNIAEIEDGGRSEIKLQYGVPEDIFQFTRFGRQIEEWCYWTQGVRFRFEAVRCRLEITDPERF